MSRSWALILGIGGLIPFVALCAAALLSGPEVAEQALRALQAWGAVIAAFLGGITWGPAVNHEQPRLYVLSTVPFLAATVELLARFPKETHLRARTGRRGGRRCRRPSGWAR